LRKDGIEECAEADSAEVVQVISIHTPFVQARAESGAE
jgi:hypothetical protein